MTHDLKTIPNEFAAAASGALRFQLRFNDRNYAIGDQIRLKEYDPFGNKYTGRTLTFDISYIVAADGVILRENYIIMSLSPIE